MKWQGDDRDDGFRDLPGVRVHSARPPDGPCYPVRNVTRGDQHSGDRVIQLWFDSSAATSDAAQSLPGKEFFAGLAEQVSGVDWLAMSNQEIFFSRALDRRVRHSRPVGDRAQAAADAGQPPAGSKISTVEISCPRCCKPPASCTSPSTPCSLA